MIAGRRLQQITRGTRRNTNLTGRGKVTIRRKRRSDRHVSSGGRRLRGDLDESRSDEILRRDRTIISDVNFNGQRLRSLKKTDRLKTINFTSLLGTGIVSSMLTRRRDDRNRLRLSRGQKFCHAGESRFLNSGDRP